MKLIVLTRYKIYPNNLIIIITAIVVEYFRTKDLFPRERRDAVFEGEEWVLDVISPPPLQHVVVGPPVPTLEISMFWIA